MGRFAEQYSEDQRQLAARLYEDHEPSLSAKDVRAMLNAGVEGFEPFDMPEPSIRNYAKTLRDERAQRQRHELAHTDPEQACRLADAAVIHAQELEAARLERASRAGKTVKTNLPSLAHYWDVRKRQRQALGQQREEATAEPVPTPPPSLLADLRARRAAESQQRNDEQGQDASGRLPFRS